MPPALNSTVKLNNNVDMPIFGLGVYRIPPGKKTYTAVKKALETGYRLVDTARVYYNEADVGKAVRDSGISRRDIFITTKLWNADQGYDPALRAFDGSLKRLGLEYIDLYLIHWPVPNLRSGSWRALEEILRSGRAHAIGVSNYTERHLSELLDQSEITPAVNQVEFSPFLFQRDLLGFCNKRGIRLESYAPLTAGLRMKDPVVTEIAKKHGRTNAQILLRWAIQHEVIVIPKTTDPSRMAENAKVFEFELSAGDMSSLDSLDEGFRSSWDPTEVP